MSNKAKPKFSIYSTRDQSPMHFSGANGFPIGCYDTLLNGLSQKYSITSLWHRGLWPNIDAPNSNLSWDDYADDLIKHLKQQHKQAIIGVGHSMGATITLMAAAKAPKLFSKLILIEPVIISPLLGLLCQYAPTRWLSGMEPVKSALAKPTTWKTKEEVFSQFKRSLAYKRIPDDHLKTIINGMVDSQSNQQTLVYPVEWEIANYLSGRNILKDVQKLKVPTAIIRGRPSLFIHDKSWHKLLRAKPSIQVINEREYGHLMPFEAPQITRQLIASAIKQLDQA